MRFSDIRKIYKGTVFKTLWLITFFGVLVLGFLFVYVAKTQMPDTYELENPKFEESTIVYAIDGPELDRYFSKNRQWVSFDELSDHLVNALIATEDHRFYQHSGIDVRGTLRAVIFLGSRGGASTISQQLAKQFFTPVRSRNPNNPEHSIWTGHPTSPSDRAR